MSAALKPATYRPRSSPQQALARFDTSQPGMLVKLPAPGAIAPVARRPSAIRSRQQAIHLHQAAQPQVQRSSAPVNLRTAATTVRTLPVSNRQPNWLTRLIAIQRGTSVVTLGLVVSALAVYGWTVYNQQLWSRNYRRLESLQRQERQLIAADEILKNQMARQAENPETGLVLPTPDSAVFLQAPKPVPAATAPDVSPLDSPALPSVYPLGY